MLNGAAPAVVENPEPRVLLSTTTPDSLYWDTATTGMEGSSGKWSDTTTNWNTTPDSSGSAVPWADGDIAVFSADPQGTATIAIPSNVTAGQRSPLSTKMIYISSIAFTIMPNAGLCISR